MDAVAAALRAGWDAVVPGLALTDTVKRVEPGPPGEAERVLETVTRAALRAVQTPQGFRRVVLEAAHATAAAASAAASGLAPVPATDDAGLVEDAGHDVFVVPGAEEAFKVTRPLDLVLAEAVLARRRAAGAR